MVCVDGCRLDGARRGWLVPMGWLPLDVSVCIWLGLGFGLPMQSFSCQPTGNVKGGSMLSCPQSRIFVQVGPSARAAMMIRGLAAATLVKATLLWLVRPLVHCPGTPTCSWSLHLHCRPQGCCCRRWHFEAKLAECDRANGFCAWSFWCWPFRGMGGET